LVVKYLFPLDYCVRLMFGSVFHLTGVVAEERDGHRLDFIADWPEDKDRQDAERMANPPPPMSAEQVERMMERGRDRTEWENKHGRVWGT